MRQHGQNRLCTHPLHDDPALHQAQPRHAPSHHVLDAPASFEVELAALQGVDIQRALPTAQACVEFMLAFAITQGQLDEASKDAVRAVQGDAVLWIAYPKASSKNYKCEFNRDAGWTVLGAAGYEPVRQVAIDADWSALRFRRVEHIQTLRRDPATAISKAGKARAATGSRT